MRRVSVPPSVRTASQAMSAHHTFPRCMRPEGVGAKRPWGACGMVFLGSGDEMTLRAWAMIAVRGLHVGNLATNTLIFCYYLA